jgi:hypothetical protein
MIYLVNMRESPEQSIKLAEGIDYRKTGQKSWEVNPLAVGCCVEIGSKGNWKTNEHDAKLAKCSGGVVLQLWSETMIFGPCWPRLESIVQPNLGSKMEYSLVNKQFAIENDHRNGGFSH